MLSTAIQRNRLGSAAPALVLLVVLLVGLGAAAWLLLARAPAGGTTTAAGPGGGGTPAAPAAPRADGARTVPPTSPSEERTASEPRAGTDLEVGGGPAPADPARFQGEGTLRGELLLPEGAELPGPWTLVVGPSRWAVGAERAATRRVEHPADARTFRLEGLPLAGYGVDVEVAGWTARAADVVLQDGAEEVFVAVELVRNGTVEGSLYRADGTSAEGVAVRLEPLDGGEAFEDVVAPAGTFRLAGVPEGNWRLVLGPPTSPLLEPRLLEVTPDGLRLPPATLPELTWFRLVVHDASGAPVAGATVSASGTPAGVARGETDEYGVFVARYAPAGRWTARVAHPDHGQVRKQFVVDLEEPFEDTLTLPR